MAEWQKRVSEYKERLVAINRITKVVKGGRRFGFAALLSQASTKLLSAMRGKKISEIVSKRENTK